MKISKPLALCFISALAASQLVACGPVTSSHQDASLASVANARASTVATTRIESQAIGAFVPLFKNASMNKISPNLVFAIDGELEDALAPRLDMFIKFSVPKTREELEKMNIKPGSIIGQIVTAQLSLEDIVRLSANSEVVSLQGSDRVLPAEGASSSGASTLPSPELGLSQEGDREATILLAKSTQLQALGETRIEKISTKVLMKIEQALEKPLASKHNGFIRFSSEKTREEIKALGIEPRTIAGDIITAVFSLHALLAATARPDVVVVEGSRRLFPNPSISVRG